MGRSVELSDFQRGTVVGCHMCKKSVREIAALLGLPRSTVSSVILKWKREGITGPLPRCGRPHKLKEEHRQVLEQVALERGLPSIKALTSEFRSASGASVSFSTVRRELHEMGFRGRVALYGKPKGERRAKRKEAAAAPGRDEDAPDDASRLDLRVGRIVSALQPPEAGGLCVQQVDVGEAHPRTVVSELAEHVPVCQMQNRMAVLLCNMRPVDVGGVETQARLVCASSPGKVEILDPPSGAAPGDRVTFQGFPGEPDKEPSGEKLWERIQPDLRTDGRGVATYRGAALEVVGKGVCRAQTMSNSAIK